MRDSRRPVTVSIVSHRHWQTVQPLLQQLSFWCASSIDRVILTVNVPERVNLDYDFGFPVEVIHNARPRGFGANHNTAFGRHTAPWFLVMNPDVRIDHDVLSSLLSRAERTAGVLAPRVQEPCRVGPEPYRMLVTPAELVRRRRMDHTPPAFPSWMAGMFLLVRSDAYRELRGFDERFFMYCEDVDLCVRLQLAGWKLQVATDSVVLHDAQRDSHSSIRPLIWHIASFFKLWTSEAFWNYLRLQKEWSELPTAPTVLLSEGRSVRGYTAAREDSRLEEAATSR
jgi:N-acetylglucosaminyl-diphospho-decaprenol L-rhamnosyltransferase